MLFYPSDGWSTHPRSNHYTHIPHSLAAVIIFFTLCRALCTIDINCSYPALIFTSIRTLSFFHILLLSLFVCSILQVPYCRMLHDIQTCIYPKHLFIIYALYLQASLCRIETPYRVHRKWNQSIAQFLRTLHNLTGVVLHNFTLGSWNLRKGCREVSWSLTGCLRAFFVTS